MYCIEMIDRDRPEGKNEMKLYSYFKYTGIMTVLILASILTLTGCGDGTETLGEGIPKEQQRVKLVEVVNSPQKYNEKTFVIEGKVESMCPMLCDFVIKDGKSTATIYSQDFKFPKLAIGTPVTVYVQATAGERLILSALGMKI